MRPAWILLYLIVLGCSRAAANIPQILEPATPLRQVHAASFPNASPKLPEELGAADSVFEHPVSGFYCLGLRHLDPASGRWTSPDPLGHTASLSLYDYADGDPINRLDPDGRVGKGIAAGYNNRSSPGNSTGGFDAGYWAGSLLGAGADGLRGGSSIAVNNLSLGYSDSKGWTDSTQYQGGAYTASRYISGAGTAGLYTAGAIVTGGALLEASPALYVAATNVSNSGLVVALGGAAVATNSGVPATANFAQTGFREAFSKTGVNELRKITGMTFNTIDDLAGALQSGAVSASRIPVNIIKRGANTLILNTRTAQALERAGIPRRLWNAVDQSGVQKFEQMLSDQLKRTQLSPVGTPLTFPE